jgi:biofilm PGA synthesis protein PgaA
MRRIILSILAPAIVFASGIADGASVPDAEQTERHQQAVELARNGDFEKSLTLLADLRTGEPGNLDLLYDETVILNWAGFDERALANAESIDISTAPDYVLESVGKAARNMGRYDDAIRWYGELLRRAPDNLDARLGLAFSHADAGNPEEAYRLLESIPGEDPTQLYLDLAEAYVHERAGRLVEALASYQRVVEYDPENAAALRGMALVLRDLLLPSDALALAKQHPGILDKSEIEQLEADVAAMAIREGAEAQQPVSATGESTGDVLARINSLLADPAIRPEVRRRLEYDRIVALTDRGRTAEAIEAFEALDGDRSAQPVYVLVSASSAYLGERRPAEARRLLEHALQRAPGDLEIRFQLFWV